MINVIELMVMLLFMVTNLIRKENIDFNNNRIEEAKNERELWNITNDVLNPRKRSDWNITREDGTVSKKSFTNHPTKLIFLFCFSVHGSFVSSRLRFPPVQREDNGTIIGCAVSNTNLTKPITTSFAIDIMCKGLS